MRHRHKSTMDVVETKPVAHEEEEEIDGQFLEDLRGLVDETRVRGIPIVIAACILRREGRPDHVIDYIAEHGCGEGIKRMKWLKQAILDANLLKPTEAVSVGVCSVRVGRE